MKISFYVVYGGIFYNLLYNGTNSLVKIHQFRAVENKFSMFVSKIILKFMNMSFI